MKINHLLQLHQLRFSLDRVNVDYLLEKKCLIRNKILSPVFLRLGEAGARNSYINKHKKIPRAKETPLKYNICWPLVTDFP